MVAAQLNFQISHGPAGIDFCLAAGMDGDVSKPIRPAALFAAIDEVMERRPVSAHEEADAGDGQVLDEAGLLELVASDAGLLGELAGLFLEDSPRRLAEIRAALDEQNLSLLRTAAHTLKGSAGSLCGHFTARVAREVETMAEKGDLSGAASLFPALGEEVARLQQALRNLVGRTA